MRPPVLALILLFYFISSIYASAFRPFVTTDIDISKKGELILEPGYEYSKESGGEGHVLSLAVIYGLTKWIEVEAGFVFLYLNPDMESSESGFGDTGLFVKFKLTGENGIFEDSFNNNYMPEIFIQPTLLIPTSVERLRFRADNFEPGILLGLGKHFSFTTINTNIGYFATNDPVTDETFQNRFFYGVEIDFPLIGDDLLVGTEITGDFATSNNEEPIFTRSGLVYQLNEHIALDAGFEYGIRDAESAKTVIAGATIAFTPFGSD